MRGLRAVRPEVSQEVHQDAGDPSGPALDRGGCHG
jgi:hypothetical protein